MAFKMKAGKEGPMKKNFPGMYGMKSVEETGSAMMMKKEASMKMKKEAPMKVAKPDFPDIDGDGNTKESMKQAAADKKSANKMKNPNVKGSKAKAYQRKLDKAAKKEKKATKKYNEAFDTGGHNTGGKGFDRKLAAADRKGRKAEKKKDKAEKKSGKILGYYKYLSKDEKKTMR